MTATSLRLLIVDDHTIVREGLKRVLDAAGSEWNLFEASNGYEALDRLRIGGINIAVVDLSMPGMPGLELVKRITNEFPTVRTLVLSMHAEEQYALRAFRAGAKGYVTKDSAAKELVHAVRRIADGGAYVSGKLAEQVVLQLNGSTDAPLHATLSDREIDVMTRLVAGQRLTEIGEALHLSVKTISTHKTRILEKLRLTSTAGLVRYAIDNGIGTGDGESGHLPF